jgi:hypothetical protein
VRSLPKMHGAVSSSVGLDPICMRYPMDAHLVGDSETLKQLIPLSWLGT